MRVEWRVGSKVPLNVYEEGRPICQCHTVTDALRIVAAMNSLNDLEDLADLAEDDMGKDVTRVREIIAEARDAWKKGTV